MLDERDFIHKLDEIRSAKKKTNDIKSSEMGEKCPVLLLSLFLLHFVFLNSFCLSIQFTLHIRDHFDSQSRRRYSCIYAIFELWWNGIATIPTHLLRVNIIRSDNARVPVYSVDIHSSSRALSMIAYINVICISALCHCLCDAKTGKILQWIILPILLRTVY